jgi:hypothetical protein
VEPDARAVTVRGLLSTGSSPKYGARPTAPSAQTSPCAFCQRDLAGDDHQSTPPYRLVENALVPAESCSSSVRQDFELVHRHALEEGHFFEDDLSPSSMVRSSGLVGCGRVGQQTQGGRRPPRSGFESTRSACGERFNPQRGAGGQARPFCRPRARGWTGFLPAACLVAAVAAGSASSRLGRRPRRPPRAAFGAGGAASVLRAGF